MFELLFFRIEFGKDRAFGRAVPVGSQSRRSIASAFGARIGTSPAAVRVGGPVAKNLGAPENLEDVRRRPPIGDFDEVRASIDRAPPLTRSAPRRGSTRARIRSFRSPDSRSAVS